MDLRRPVGLDDDEWTPIASYVARLVRAEREHDLPLVVGTAKELIETVGKVVVEVRGETIGSSADMNELLTRAHRALARQPGEGIATEPPMRNIAQALKTLALNVNELRNRVGTGHGRTTMDALDEHADTAKAAALLWCGWALRRLEKMIGGLPAPLIRDLRGKVFHRGDLRSRLAMANLPDLDDANQQSLGLAVGQRAASGTFVVVEDGVEPCAVDPTLDTWPSAYRIGVLQGLFLDRNGYITTVPFAARLAPLVADPLPNVDSVVDQLTVTIRDAEPANTLSTSDGRLEVAQAIRDSATATPNDDIRSKWYCLAEEIELSGNRLLR
jgi:Abortive infection C-terminus